jgi:hypothetical protein
LKVAAGAASSSGCVSNQATSTGAPPLVMSNTRNPVV